MAPLDDSPRNQSGPNPRLDSEATSRLFTSFSVCISLNEDPFRKDVSGEAGGNDKLSVLYYPPGQVLNKVFQTVDLVSAPVKAYGPQIDLEAR